VPDWLTYAQAGDKFGMSAEAVRLRARRFGWRTQPGNDGRTLVQVPDDAAVQPRPRPDGRSPGQPPVQVAEIARLTDLLTAAERRADRAEKQVDQAEQRVDRAEKQADAADSDRRAAEARADKLDQALAGERSRADELRDRLDDLGAKLADAQAELAAAQNQADAAGAQKVAAVQEAFEQTEAELRSDLEAAQMAQAEAEADAAELRQAEVTRQGRGRWTRLRQAWRGA
jgi:putative drug exporter of the RND superfamily